MREGEHPLTSCRPALCPPPPSTWILWPLRSLDVANPCCPVLRKAKGQRMLNNLRGTSGLELYRELCHTCSCILARVDTKPCTCTHTHTRTYTDELAYVQCWPIPVMRSSSMLCVRVRTYVCLCVRRESCQGNSILHAWIIALGFLGHARLISQGYIFRVSFPRANVVERRGCRRRCRRRCRRDTRRTGWLVGWVYKPGIHHVIPWRHPRVGPREVRPV